MERIGFVGGGNMAQALIEGIISANLYQPENILVSDIDANRLKFLADSYGVRTFSDNNELAGQVDLLILAVKPQIMEEVVEPLKGIVKPESLIVTIAAGIKTGTIRKYFSSNPIIRVMPNTPGLVGAGTCGVYADQKAEPMLDSVMKIFSAAGKAVRIENEELMDAVTAVSGSGPAYFFLLMESMVNAGKELGLDHKTATGLVLQTAKGAAELAMDADKKGGSPAELRQKVTSPGGTTEAALNVFNDRDFEEIVKAGVKIAFERSRELSG